MKHELRAFEEDFLENGVRSVCTCGWHSEIAKDREAALALGEQHEKESNKQEKQDVALAYYLASGRANSSPTQQTLNRMDKDWK